MKLLHYINGMWAGGKERRLLELLKYTKARDLADVQLAVMAKEISYPELLDLRIPIHYLIRRTKKDVRIVPELFRICRSFRPDIIHVWDGMTAVYAVPVSRLLGIPLVNGMITDAPNDLGSLRASRMRPMLTFPFSHAVVGNSRVGLSIYGAPKEKSFCIYNGFNKSRLKDLPPPASVREWCGVRTRFLVGMVGVFSTRKDFGTYLTAAQQLLAARDDVTFVTVGKGEDEERCKGLVEARWRERILFLGWRPDVEAIVNAMDVCVLSSFSEGLSNSILEYMALGKPVVATDVGGTREVVVEGETGFLVPPLDAARMAGRIALLLDDPGRACAMGEKGQRRVESTFSIERMSADYFALYKAVLQGRVGAAAREGLHG